jgi:hypothetical protein
MPKEFTPSSSADSKPPIPNTPDNSPIPVKEDEGSGFQDSRLVFRQDSIAVKSTRKAFLFHALFMALGPLLICFGLFNGDSIEWLALVVGIGFTIPVVCYLYESFKSTAPFFDVVDGTFYPNGFTRDGSGISLKQFDHLEILWKRVKRNSNTANHHPSGLSFKLSIGSSSDYNYFYSYELNVVLKDGSRYNIMDHGNDKRLLDDAKRLADRLSLPLINANTAETIAREQTYIPSSKQPLTIGVAIIIFVIFGLMFFCVGSVLTYFISIRPLCGWFSSANWTPTPARVVSSQLSFDIDRGERLYGIDIQYVYNINGTPYTGSRYDFYLHDNSKSNLGVKKMREIVSSMPGGKEITCLVNPANPAESVISRKFEWIRFLFSLIPLPFPFIGIIVMIYIIRTLRRQKAQSQLAPHPASQ